MISRSNACSNSARFICPGQRRIDYRLSPADRSFLVPQGKHRFDELGLVPWDIDREFGQVVTMRIAQPFARKDNDRASGILVHSRRGLSRLAFQRAQERTPQGPADKFPRCIGVTTRRLISSRHAAPVRSSMTNWTLNYPAIPKPRQSTSENARVSGDRTRRSTGVWPLTGSVAKRGSQPRLANG